MDYSRLANDVGLLCFILGISKEEQVIRDPLVGNIFENSDNIHVLNFSNVESILK